MAVTDAQPGTGFSQRNYCISKDFIDQHGRVFYAEADKSDGHPRAELVCTSHRLPWQPPMRFLKPMKEHAARIEWDYERMAEELSGSTAHYYTEVRKFATLHMPSDIPDVGGEVSRLLRDIFGPPPLSPAIPLAAQQGDRWLLTGEGENPRLFALLSQGASMSGKETLDIIRATLDTNNPVINEAAIAAAKNPAAMTYTDFSAEARKAGMTSQAEIATAWRAHKDNLKEAAAA